MPGIDTRFSAAIDTTPTSWAPHHNAGLAHLLELMPENDARRLKGDLLNRAANSGWAYRVGMLERLDAEQLRKDWRRAYDNDEVKYVFGVQLEGRSSHMDGLLTVSFRRDEGRAPRYLGVSINT